MLGSNEVSQTQTLKNALMRWPFLFLILLMSCGPQPSNDVGESPEMSDSTFNHLGVSFNPAQQLQNVAAHNATIDSLQKIGQQRIDSNRRVIEQSRTHSTRTEPEMKSNQNDDTFISKKGRPLTYFTKENKVACYNKKLMKDFVSYAVDQDLAAMQMLLDADLCVQMKGGLEVYITDHSWGLIGFRLKGDVSEYWTLSENVSKR